MIVWFIWLKIIDLDPGFNPNPGNEPWIPFGVGGRGTFYVIVTINPILMESRKLISYNLDLIYPEIDDANLKGTL